MAGIVTQQSACAGGGHHTLTVTLDGVAVTVNLHDLEAQEPMTAAELAQFVRLGVRRLRQQGVTLAQFLGRCTHGDEATNVKIYDFFGPGAAITKTNIGTAYVNIPPGLNGERIVVDFTGCTQFRFLMNANLIGTGQWGARCIRDSDSEVLIEQANLGAAGERELDSDWQNLPAAFLGQGLMFLRVQAKSTTAADDPLFRRCQLGLR